MRVNLFFTLMIVGIVIASVGCIQKDSSSDTASSTEANDIQLEKPETIETILKKKEDIDSMYYEISMNMDISNFGKQTAMIKIWHKEPYIKEEITSEAGGYST